MTTADAIQAAVDQLPGIPQDPDSYQLLRQTDYADWTVWVFNRKPSGTYPITQLDVRVEQNRLTSPATVHARYQVI